MFILAFVLLLWLKTNFSLVLIPSFKKLSMAQTPLADSDNLERHTHKHTHTKWTHLSAWLTDAENRLPRWHREPRGATLLTEECEGEGVSINSLFYNISISLQNLHRPAYAQWALVQLLLISHAALWLNAVRHLVTLCTSAGFIRRECAPTLESSSMAPAATCRCPRSWSPPWRPSRTSLRLCKPRKTTKL